MKWVKQAMYNKNKSIVINKEANQLIRFYVRMCATHTYIKYFYCLPKYLNTSCIRVWGAAYAPTRQVARKVNNNTRATAMHIQR
jgi:hypothetical protein